MDQIEKILDFVDKNMEENGSEWALGSEAYSMGDVHLTNILTRLQMNQSITQKLFETHPKIKAYWQKV